MEKFLQGAFGQVTYELIFFDVQESHYGTYKCNIENAEGGGYTEITLASKQFKSSCQAANSKHIVTLAA